MVFLRETCRQRLEATQVCRGANTLLLSTLVLSTAIVHSKLCTVRQAVLAVHAVLSAESKWVLWSDLLAG